MKRGFKACVLIFACITAGSISSAAAAQDGEVQVLDCPRTIATEPAAQLIAQDAQVLPAETYYSTGLGRDGFCVQEVGYGETVLTTYQEMNDLNGIPVRFAYLPFGIDIYLGAKANAPLNPDAGPADIRCTRSVATKGHMTCEVSADPRGLITIPVNLAEQPSLGAVRVSTSVFGPNVVSVFAPATDMFGTPVSRQCDASSSASSVQAVDLLLETGSFDAAGGFAGSGSWELETFNLDQPDKLEFKVQPEQIVQGLLDAPHFRLDATVICGPKENLPMQSDSALLRAGMQVASAVVQTVMQRRAAGTR